MRILFLTDEFYPSFGANSLVIKVICDELVVKGHQPYVMPFNYKEELSGIEEWQGITVVRCIQPDNERNMLQEFSNGRIVNAFLIGAHALYLKFINHNDFRMKGRISARRFIEKWIEQNQVDAVVSICSSIELSFPLLYLRERMKLQCKWLLYMIDPFESHEYYRRHSSIMVLRKWQHRLMLACDSVIATDQVYKDMANWEDKDTLEKTQRLMFPKIIEPVLLQCADDIELPKDVINVVYTGSRNEQSRNSAYVMMLCNQLQDKNIRFHFIGNGWGVVDDQLSDKIVFYPSCSWQAAHNVQLRADYLLNIGNSAINQIPSKVLEYISTGKPIIDFVKSNDCPTIALLRGYDALIIPEQIDGIAKASKKLSTYVCKVHCRLSFEEIQSKYIHYTPRHVVERLISLTWLRR